MAAQGACVAIRFATAVGLTFVRLLVAMRHHVSVSAGGRERGWWGAAKRAYRIGKWISGSLWGDWGAVRFINLQVILPLECLRAERTNIFPFVAVRQFVLGQRGGISKDLAANL